MARATLQVLLLSASLLVHPAAASQDVDQKFSGEPRPARTLPAEIPIFPLDDVVLFPGMSEPLHIFESRYRAMVADALKGDRVIGMVLLQPGFEADYEGRPSIYPVGCAGEIVDVEELADGRFNIVLRAIGKFRVVSEDQSRLYRLARVDAVPEISEDSEPALGADERGRLQTAVQAYTGRPDLEIPSQVPDVELVNVLSRRLELAPLERQMLLQQDGVRARFQALVDLLEIKVAALP
jgi:Lon protease-like protein